jgi:large subunit ribosomal protein L21
MKMKFAIVESGGKQYRAVEGATIDVDRLVHEVGKTFDFERILFVAEDDDVMVGTPTVGGIKVSATVLGHVKGPKVVTFKYRPKKRIRVKSGHRHQFTRLLIDFIGKPGEEREAVKKETPAAVEIAEAKTEAKVEKQAKARKKEAAKPSSKEKKPAAKKSTTAKKSTPKSSAKK